MSIKFNWNASIAVAVLSIASVVGCVADRPARNGVFNENQYLRKDFLIAPGDGPSPDTGLVLQVHDRRGLHAQRARQRRRLRPLRPAPRAAAT